MPETAITIDQAALEILEGLEAGRGILSVMDFARARCENIRIDAAKGDPLLDVCHGYVARAFGSAEFAGLYLGRYCAASGAGLIAFITYYPA